MEPGSVTPLRWLNSCGGLSRAATVSRWRTRADCLLSVLRHGDATLTVVTNGATASNNRALRLPGDWKPTPLWGDTPALHDG
jgi:hypothetical protein